MKRLRKHPSRVIALCAAVALVVGVVASSAMGKGTTVRAGTLVLNVDGSFSPKKLPKKKLAPITLKLHGAISTSDHSHVPALKVLSLDFDKHGTVYTKGLPTCTTGKLANTLTKQALRACRKALVGKGKVTAEVQFPDQAPIPAKGTLLLFNGKPKGKTPVIITHTFVTYPVSATFVVAGKIKKTHKGKYGTNVKLVIPPIAQGQGSLTGFDAKINRKWTYKRKKRSYVVAKCANGHFFAHGDFTFVNGTKLSGNVVKSCKAKR